MIELTPEEEAKRRRRMIRVGLAAAALMVAAVVIYLTTFDLLWSILPWLAALAVVVIFHFIPELRSRIKRGWRGW